MLTRAMIMIGWAVSMIGGVACDPPPAPPSSTGTVGTTAVTSSKPMASAAPTSTVTPSKSTPDIPKVASETARNGVILPLDYPWSRGKKRWAANAAAVAEAEYCIARELPKMKTSPAYQVTKLPEIVRRLKEYRRQYMGFTNEEGRDLLWVNFFRDPKDRHPDWRTSLVTVRGGGHDYFNVAADVAAGTCGELQINSPR